MRPECSWQASMKCAVARSHRHTLNLPGQVTEMIFFAFASAATFLIFLLAAICCFKEAIRLSICFRCHLFDRLFTGPLFSFLPRPLPRLIHSSPSGARPHLWRRHASRSLLNVALLLPECFDFRAHIIRMVFAPDGADRRCRCLRRAGRHILLRGCHLCVGSGGFGRLRTPYTHFPHVA